VSLIGFHDAHCRTRFLVENPCNKFYSNLKKKFRHANFHFILQQRVVFTAPIITKLLTACKTPGNDQLDTQLLYFIIRLLQSSTCFSNVVLIIRR